MTTNEPLCTCGHGEEYHNSDFRDTAVPACHGVNGCDCQDFTPDEEA